MTRRHATTAFAQRHSSTCFHSRRRRMHVFIGISGVRHNHLSCFSWEHFSVRGTQALFFIPLLFGTRNGSALCHGLGSNMYRYGKEVCVDADIDVDDEKAWRLDALCLGWMMIPVGRNEKLLKCSTCGSRLDVWTGHLSFILLLSTLNHRSHCR
jgi:hypothetical protein